MIPASLLPLRPARAFRPLFPTLAANALAALAALTPPAATAYVGEWQVYTDKSRVTALAAHDGFVYAGTQGGIRRIDPATLAERDFDNLDGLLDPWITGLAVDSTADVLWAAGRDGYLYELAPGGDRWSIHGRSYASQGWRLNDRALLAADSNLYLGSPKGLSVFDTRQKLARVNVTRFGDEVDVSVLSLRRRGDTLYVGTSVGVYKAFVNFADPANPEPGQGNLLDFNHWIEVELPADSARRFDHLAFFGDSLATFGPGTLLQAPDEAPVEVRAFADSPLVVGSRTWPAAWDGFTSALAFAGKIFAGGDTGLVVSEDPLAATAPDTTVRPPLLPHPRDTIANISARNGWIWGHSRGGIHRLMGTPLAFEKRLPPATDPEAMYARFLRNLYAGEDGIGYVGGWGIGLQRFTDAGAVSAWNAGTDSCFFKLSSTPGSIYAVVHALSAPRNGSIYLAMLKGEGAPDHQFVHFDTETEAVSCLVESLPGGAPHAVAVLADTLVAVATNVGVNFVVVREGASGPSVESSALWTSDGAANEAWDLAVDAQGYVWTIIGDRLSYADSIATSTERRLKSVDNFIGRGCRGLEADPAGELWVGCDNGLFHVRPAADGTLAAVRRYGPDDGLPGSLIYDLSVDPTNGRVWIATDRGVATLEGPSKPEVPAGRVGTIVAYPNPFRPRHAFVLFENLPVNATLRIHDPRGLVVRTFRPRDITGNQIRWDGLNDHGRRVAPGVYQFSVKSGSGILRGKLIVAR